MSKCRPVSKPPVDDAYIKRIIESLPPLPDEACQRIAALLMAGGE